jgi:hypothetical protein
MPNLISIQLLLPIFTSVWIINFNPLTDLSLANNSVVEIDNWSDKLTFPQRLFRDYDDRQCFKYTWLIQYPLYENKTLKSLAAGNTKIKPQTEDVEQLLVFYSDEQGHLGMTREALESIVKTTSEPSKSLQFTPEAMEEIMTGNRDMDISDYSFLSPTLSIPCIHFNNEQFHDASSRLIDLKMRIISVLTISPRDGREARYLLGSALHTIQDFYAHSNWIELGFTEIDKRLGREIIPNPPQDMYSSHPISKSESLAIYQQYQANLPPTKLDKLKPLNYEQMYEYDHDFRQRVQQIATAKSEQSGQLLPEFMNSKDKSHLTSGYFIGIGAIASCTAPVGKTRHGSGLFGCPQGLSKDESQHELFPEVRRLALLATQDYLQQIIATLDAKGDLKAIETLMGIE